MVELRPPGDDGQGRVPCGAGDRDRCEGIRKVLGNRPISSTWTTSEAVVKHDPIPVDQEDLAVSRPVAECPRGLVAW